MRLREMAHRGTRASAMKMTNNYDKAEKDK